MASHWVEIFSLKSFNTIIFMIIRYVQISSLGHPYGNLRKCDIYGIGAAVSGTMGALANITATELTNQANRDIARENNETQIKIHEDDRAFNAEEAEKTRQWNSEQAVMERRKEAGLNIVNPQGISGGSGGSNATASAPSAPQLVTPTMQAPQIDFAGTLGAVIDGFKASSEISESKSRANLNAKQAENVANDAIYKEQLSQYQTIVNEYTPKQLTALIDKLSSESSLNSMQENLARASITRTLQDAKNGIFGIISSFFGQDMNKEELRQTAIQFFSGLTSDAQHQLHKWTMDGIDMSFKYGNHYEQGFDNNLSLGVDYRFTGSGGIGSFRTGSGSSSGSGSGGNTRSFNLASFVGVNGSASSSFGANVGLSLGSSQLSKFIQQNPAVYLSVRDIFSAEMYSHIQKDKNAVLHALQAIKSRAQYLQDYFQLDAQITNHLLQQEQTFLRSN